MLAGPVATVHVWRLPVGTALRRVVADRSAVRREPGVRFAKICGTTRTGRFGIREADLRRWLMVTSFEDDASATRFEHSRPVQAWTRAASEHWRARLRPLGARGRWSRRMPFLVEPAPRWSGPVLAITRARLAPRTVGSFWRAVPAPAASLSRDPAVEAAFGFGEAPVGVQGTLSLWPDAASMRRYAYAGREHREVVRRTAEAGWYAEELFSHFALLESDGTLDGRRPFGGAG